MKKLISLIVSIVILGVIYWTIDLSNLFAAFVRTDPVFFIVAIAMVVPIVLLTALRLKWLIPREADIGVVEATRLILISAVLNMVLPAKMGDLAKFAFMRREGVLSGSLAFSTVIFEKTTDLLALLIWCAFGLAFFSGDAWLLKVLSLAIGIGIACGFILISSERAARFFFDLCRRFGPSSVSEKINRLAEAWETMHRQFWKKKEFAVGIFLFSLFLWFLHLFQIWMFILALGGPVSLLSNLALTPLAILAGLLPLTFAGIGTRDAALIFLFAGFMDPGTGAALGLLCTLRYVLPAMGGVPFIGEALATLRKSSD